MKRWSEVVEQSVPYEVAVTRHLPRTDIEERRARLEEVGFNTYLIPQDEIYVDLMTDGATGSTAEIEACEPSGDVGPWPGTHPAFRELQEVVQRIFGFAYVVPAAFGRAAERIWASTAVEPGMVVATNLTFATVRLHAEQAGATIADVIDEQAFDPRLDAPFKGNVDLQRLERVLAEADRACVYLELPVNECGGHPVSIENLRAVREIAGRFSAPVYLDATRILENCWLVKQRERTFGQASIAEIARASCDLADALTLSGQKDFSLPRGGLIAVRDAGLFDEAHTTAFLHGAFPTPEVIGALGRSLRTLFEDDRFAAHRAEQVERLARLLVAGGVPVVRPAGAHAVFLDLPAFLPHLSPEDEPADALAAHLYLASGIRVTRGIPPNAQMTERGRSFLRFAIPVRRYLDGHIDDVARALVLLHERRDAITGLRQIEGTGSGPLSPHRYRLSDRRSG